MPDWDGSTSRKLFESLQAVKSKLGFKMGQLAEFLVMKTMRPAQYCSLRSGAVHHYALSFDFYTHFTSPIRRYPDILVHRQLQTILELGACCLDPLTMEPSEPEIVSLEQQCTLCNAMKKKSREAQESCEVSFFCIYLRNKKEVNCTRGTVMSVTEKCLNIYVPKLGKDCPVFFKLTSKVPDWYLAGDPRRADLEDILKGPLFITYVNPSEAVVTWSESDSHRVKLFDQLDLVIVPLETVPISFATILLPPRHAKFAAKDAEEEDAIFVDHQ